MGSLGNSITGGGMLKAIVVICIVMVFVEVSGNPGEAKAVVDLESMEKTLEISRHERLAARISQPDATLNTFVTDGCSGGLSIGWSYLAERIDLFAQAHSDEPPWRDCCVIHDFSYHQGGAPPATPDESFMARRQADEELRDCVEQVGENRVFELSEAYGLNEDEVADLYRVIAGLMYRAVRVGGVPCSGLPWRWGYGWPECK
jgi:hypothetical protein